MCSVCANRNPNTLQLNISPPETSLLHDNVAFVLCLDTLAKGDDLYTHVSRPPKPDTPAHSFIQQLEEVTGFTLTVRTSVSTFCQK